MPITRRVTLKKMNNNNSNNNLTSNILNDQNIQVKEENSVAYIFIEIFEFLYFIFCLAFLVKIIDKHRHNLQPVHIVTINVLVDLEIIFFNYCIYDLLHLLGFHGFEKIQITIGLILWLWVILDVTLQDLDGFIFVRWDVYYYNWITNKRIVISVIRGDFSKNKISYIDIDS